MLAVVLGFLYWPVERAYNRAEAEALANAAEDWYIIYCNIARALCRQGFIVCISSHKEVREELARNPAQNQVIVYPTHILKDKWINKLRYRYEETQSIKDFKALRNAEDCFDGNITDLANQKGFDKISVGTMDYNLADILELNRR